MRRKQGIIAIIALLGAAIIFVALYLNRASSIGSMKRSPDPTGHHTQSPETDTDPERQLEREAQASTSDGANPSATAPLVLRLLDDATGQPISEVDEILIVIDWEERSVPDPVGAEGDWTLPNWAREATSVRVTAPNYCPSRKDVDASSSLWSVHLLPLAELSIEFPGLTPSTAAVRRVWCAPISKNHDLTSKHPVPASKLDVPLADGSVALATEASFKIDGVEQHPVMVPRGVEYLFQIGIEGATLDYSPIVVAPQLVQVVVTDTEEWIHFLGPDVQGDGVVIAARTEGKRFEEAPIRSGVAGMIRSDLQGDQHEIIAWGPGFETVPLVIGPDAIPEEVQLKLNPATETVGFRIVTKDLLNEQVFGAYLIGDSKMEPLNSSARNSDAWVKINDGDIALRSRDHFAKLMLRTLTGEYATVELRGFEPPTLQRAASRQHQIANGPEAVQQAISRFDLKDGDFFYLMEVGELAGAEYRWSRASFMVPVRHWMHADSWKMNALVGSRWRLQVINLSGEKLGEFPIDS